VCLLGTFVALVIALNVKDEHGERFRLGVVRLSKEVLVFTKETAMLQSMRHMQTEYNRFCKKADFKIDLPWDENNAKDFDTGKNSTLYGMSPACTPVPYRCLQSRSPSTFSLQSSSDGGTGSIAQKTNQKDCTSRGWGLTSAGGWNTSLPLHSKSS
jgi:hypothetical protein